jgi:hypothetical protein
VKAVLCAWSCRNEMHVLDNSPSKFKNVHNVLYFTATIETDVIQYSDTFLNNVNCSLIKAECLL